MRKPKELVAFEEERDLKLTLDLVHFGDRYGELFSDVLEAPLGLIY